MAGILIHIGLNKTATTFLQRTVFRPANGYTRTWVGSDKGEVVEHLMLTHPARFDAAAVRARFDALHEGFDPALVRTVSHEALGGSERSRWHETAHVPGRVHAVFPEARILVGIREQRDMLFSGYDQYVRQGGSLPLERYLGLEAHAPGFRPACSMEQLEYDLLVRPYAERFGADRVLVVPYEAFRAEPAATLCRIHAFAGAPEVAQEAGERVNRGLGMVSNEILRRANGLLRGAEGWDGHRRRRLPLQWVKHAAVRRIDPLIPSGWHEARAARLRAVIREATEGRYAESNRRLEAMTGLSLGALGYET